MLVRGAEGLRLRVATLHEIHQCLQAPELHLVVGAAAERVKAKAPSLRAVRDVVIGGPDPEVRVGSHLIRALELVERCCGHPAKVRL